MLDLFTIFSKGGIVLWYFQGTAQTFTSSVNALIKSVILQERGGTDSFSHEALTLKYKLDNEFELVFVVAYQKILQLSYVDKFLSDIQMEFRNKYKDDLQVGKISRNFSDFESNFLSILKEAETASKQEAKAPRAMRSFGESHKSKKNVGSMIESRKDDKPSKKKGKGGEGNKTQSNVTADPSPRRGNTPNKPAAAPVAMATSPEAPETNGGIDEETIRRNREKLFASKTMKKSGSSPALKSMSNGKSPGDASKKKTKEARLWDKGGTSRDMKVLDHSKAGDDMDAAMVNGNRDMPNAEEMQWVGQMKGELHNMGEDESSAGEEEEEEEVVVAAGQQKVTTSKAKAKANTAKSGGGAGGGGFLSGLRGLVGSKTLTAADVQPALDKMKDHLIGKNVAADIAVKLCESMSTRLEGKVLGTFNTVAATVKTALNDSCVQLLSPRRRVDILRDALECRQQKRPYSITFCGVNGVGKSTNLAKVAFWLVENGFRVLIAACDTFRAGAVEQLRTHTRKLNALHPADAHGGQQMVQLYEKGYGKDAAGIAMEAINYARDLRVDVVLVDTAGRMQDNEPLMRALAKLIKVNQPDLVLFVGEALVGNEAVDQLTKFNQALADHSNMDNPRLIDGILLTKFDTIDDKVGAAISMTYTTGQPIVFVGTGQTYTDLKNLNARSVVQALLRP